MNRRIALACLPLMLLALAAAKPVPRRAAPPPPPPPPIGDVVDVEIVTELGRIRLALDHVHAPVTTETFVHYLDQHRFDGAVFYRVMRLKWGMQPNGLIQGGLQGNPARVLPPIVHEPTSQTGLTHKRGAISMARNAPGTARADFTIMMSDLTGLDADPKSDNPEFQAGFAVFGEVTSGMDVAQAIFDAPISETRGEGIMKGQMIEVPVKIITARRIIAPPPASTAAAPAASEALPQ